LESRQKNILILAAILATTLIVYWPSLRGQFTNWDDRPLVAENPAIRSLAPGNVAKIFVSTNRGAYLPVRLLSYAVDYSVWGSNPLGYHLVNVLLHALNAFLVYLLVGRLFGSVGAALAAAFFFVAHPVQVESVAWISGRKEVQCGFFLLLSLLCYPKRYAPSLVFFLLACLSKASAIVLPMLLVLIFVVGKQKGGATHTSPLQSTDSPFAPARWRELAKLLWPFFAVAAVIFAVNVAVGASYGVVKSYRGAFVATALTMTRVVADYIQSILLPTDLSAKYFVIPVTSPLSGAFLSAACLIVALALLIAAAYVRTRKAGGVQASSLHDGARMAALGGIWFIVALLPFLNIIPTSTLRADRYLYMAMVGAGVIFAGAMNAIPWRGARTSLGIVALVCLGALSWQRAHIWKDSVALWLDTVAKSPLSPMSHANLGAAYLERGERDLAEQQFQDALACDPNFALALTNLSLIWSEQGKRDQALGAARRAVSADPANADAQLNLGRLQAEDGDLDAAYLSFGEAVKDDPYLADAYYDLAQLHLLRGELHLAESNARKALQLGLADAQAILDQIKAKQGGKHP